MHFAIRSLANTVHIHNRSWRHFRREGRPTYFNNDEYQVEKERGYVHQYFASYFEAETLKTERTEANRKFWAQIRHVSCDLWVGPYS